MNEESFPLGQYAIAFAILVGIVSISCVIYALIRSRRSETKFSKDSIFKAYFRYLTFDECPPVLTFFSWLGNIIIFLGLLIFIIKIIHTIVF